MFHWNIDVFKVLVIGSDEGESWLAGDQFPYDNSGLGTEKIFLSALDHDSIAFEQTEVFRQFDSLPRRQKQLGSDLAEAQTMFVCFEQRNDSCHHGRLQ